MAARLPTFVRHRRHGAGAYSKRVPTLTIGSPSSHSIAPAIHPKLPYDPVRDFTPVALLATAPFVLVAHPALPVRNVKELIALAKSRPGQLKAYALSVKLVNAPRRGVGQPINKDTVVVRVRTEDGITGYGESHHGLAPKVVADIVNWNLAPIVVGADAMEVEEIWQEIYTKQGQTHGPGWALCKALSGVDMALWDARGKALKLPVYRLLGGARKKIRAYAGGVCLGFQEPPKLLGEAQRFVAQGFTALKLRLGDSVERDVERVRFVRKGLGDKVDIMVDVNTRYCFSTCSAPCPRSRNAASSGSRNPFRRTP